MNGDRLMRILILLSAIGFFYGCSEDPGNSVGVAPGYNSTGTAAERSDEPQPPEFRVYESTAIDSSADACTDFYQYACGGWHAANPRPEGRALWGRFFTQYRDQVAEYTRLLIENASTDSSSADERKMAIYYRACLREDLIEEAGLDAFDSLFRRIDSAVSPREFAGALAEATLLSDYYNDAPLLTPFVDGDPIAGASIARIDLYPADPALQSASNYSGSNKDVVSLQLEYRKYLANILRLIGVGDAGANDLAQRMYLIEAELARRATPYSERRNDASTRTALRTVDELATEFSAFDWVAYFGELGLEDVDVINVHDRRYLAALNDQLTDENLPALKALIKIRLVESSRLALPAAVRAAYFDMYGRALFGEREPRARWRSCVDALKSDLREPLGRVFLTRVLEPSTPALANEIFDEVKSEMRRRIEAANWLSDASKTEALKKVERVRFFPGVPDDWTDRDGFAVADTDFLSIRQSLAAAHRERAFANLGAPLDLNNWYFPITEPMGYQDNDVNAVYMTAAMLYPYGIEQDDPGIRYGGLGVFLAHELSHGFDTLGSQYDSFGRQREWWRDDEKAAFAEKTQCVRDEAAGLRYPSGDPVNADLVVSEYTAELTANQIAYDLLIRAAGDDDLNARRHFFETTAQFYCLAANEQTWRDIAKEDSHIWGKPAVNNLVRNLPGFAEAYSCASDDAMVKTPGSSVCRVW